MTYLQAGTRRRNRVRAAVALGCRNWRRRARRCLHPVSFSHCSGMGILGQGLGCFVGVWLSPCTLSPSPAPNHGSRSRLTLASTSVVRRAGATSPALSHQQPFAFEQTQTGGCWQCSRCPPQLETGPLQLLRRARSSQQTCAMAQRGSEIILFDCSA